MSIFVLQGSGSCRRFVSHRARSITAEETYIVRALSHCARREPSKRRHPSPKTAQRHFAKSAFTLLELMIVVIIVGILAALAIPWFTKAVEKARWGEVVQTLGAIRRACELHYAEFGDYPAPPPPAPPTISFYLNGPNKNYPASLDIGIPEPDDDGRYGYFTAPRMVYPICALGVHDKDKNGNYSTGEPYIMIYYDGHFASFFGAPEF